MPEYLHPGVYVEETSFRGKSIEGVSTSTAGLVGRASRGPEGTPTLVTSFAEFVRTFGAPFAIADGVTPGWGDYLGHAVRAFFDNGGQRAYIVRTLTQGPTAMAASNVLTRGVAITLAPNTFLREGTTALRVSSLRGVTATSGLHLFVRDPGTAFPTTGIALTQDPTGFDEAHHVIKLSAALGAALGGRTSVSWQDAYLTIDGVANPSGAG